MIQISSYAASKLSVVDRCGRQYFTGDCHPQLATVITELIDLGLLRLEGTYIHITPEGRRWLFERGEQ